MVILMEYAKLKKQCITTTYEMQKYRLNQSSIFNDVDC